MKVPILIVMCTLIISVTLGLVSMTEVFFNGTLYDLDFCGGGDSVSFMQGSYNNRLTSHNNDYTKLYDPRFIKVSNPISAMQYKRTMQAYPNTPLIFPLADNALGVTMTVGVHNGDANDVKLNFFNQGQFGTFEHWVNAASYGKLYLAPNNVQFMTNLVARPPPPSPRTKSKCAQSADSVLEGAHYGRSGKDNAHMVMISDYPDCASAGWADMTCKGGCNLYIRRELTNSKDYINMNTLAHEFGHNLGAQHGSSFINGNFGEYTDPHSIMGISGVFMFNALHAHLLGFSEVLVVNKATLNRTGGIDLVLNSLEQTHRHHAVRIVLSRYEVAWYVSFRTNDNYGRLMNLGDPLKSSSDVRGAIDVHCEVHAQGFLVEGRSHYHGGINMLNGEFVNNKFKVKLKDANLRPKGGSSDFINQAMINIQLV
jgi:hypothetical protein